VLFCHARPHYLNQTLASLSQLPGLRNYSVYVSQDGVFANVSETISGFNATLSRKARTFEHWQKVRPPGKKQGGPAWISQHYKWGLSRVFEDRNHSHAIMLEEDMLLSPGEQPPTGLLGGTGWTMYVPGLRVGQTVLFPPDGITTLFYSWKDCLLHYCQMYLNLSANYSHLCSWKNLAWLSDAMEPHSTLRTHEPLLPPTRPWTLQTSCTCLSPPRGCSTPTRRSAACPRGTITATPSSTRGTRHGCSATPTSRGWAGCSSGRRSRSSSPAGLRCVWRGGARGLGLGGIGQRATPGVRLAAAGL
jgi:hypothetical protein